MFHINFHHLLYFREIAREMSVTKAAKNLRLSAPALSMQLKTFEDVLGQALFDRVGRGLSLTPFGKALLEYAEKAHYLRDELIYFTNSRNLRSKPVRIGLTDELPKSLTKIIVMETKKKFQEISFSLREGHTSELSSAIISEDLDLILTSRPTFISKDFLCKKFYQKEISFYGTKEFKPLKKDFPESLEDAPVILPNLHNEIRDLIDQWFIEKRIHYQLVAETQDSSVKKTLALEKLGMIPLSDFSSKEFVKAKKLFKIGSLNNVSESFFITSKKSNFTKNEIVKHIHETLLKASS